MTLEFFYKRYLIVIFLLLLGGCFQVDKRIQKISSTDDQSDPSLSGNGNFLAFTVDQKGKKIIRLKDLRTGQLLPLRYLSQYEYSFSPSLSWNGRYLAAITRVNTNELVLIEDRISGRFYRLPNYGNLSLISISMTPDATTIVVEADLDGRKSFQFFDLTKKLDQDVSKRIDEIKFMQNN